MKKKAKILGGTMRELYLKGKGANKDKKLINEFVAKSFKKVENLGSFIVLESANLLTLKTLTKHKVNLSKVDIPNPVKETYDEIKRHHDNTYQELLGEYLDRMHEVPENKECYAGVWFDYCCSILGNDTITPKGDIFKYFQYKLPADKSILAYTFSSRWPKTTFKYENIYKMEKFVQEVAFKHGYVAIKIPEGTKSYPAGMFFNAFTIFKI